MEILLNFSHSYHSWIRVRLHRMLIYINKIKYSVEGKNFDQIIFFNAIALNASKKIKSSAGFDAIAQSI